MQRCVNIKVEDIDSPKNIKNYLIQNLGFSNSLIRRVKWGGVFINGEEVHMRATVKPGDRLEIFNPKESSEGILPVYKKIEILYEDEWILAVNKPQDMPVHPSRGNSLVTLANCVMAYMGDEFVFRAASRLDRDTSGIVLIAKNQLASANLNRAIKKGEYKKTYYAIVDGIIDAPGVIDAPIDREAEGSIKRIVCDKGKSAITHYEPIRRLCGERTICKITPLTGRTHQIRVHMAYIGHPLSCDFLYGRSVYDGQTKLKYKLHCGKVSFPHPKNGETIEIVCPCDFI